MPFYWEFIHVDIVVEENGDLLISETQKYVFTGPYTTERYRWIPLEKIDRITDVQVIENGRELKTFTEIKDNQFWIRWTHTLNPPETHTFVVRYRVQGGLHIHKVADQLWWKAIFKNRNAPIQSGKVIVHLPAILAGHIHDINYSGISASVSQVDARTIQFVPHGLLSPGQELEVQVAFAPGVLDVPVPDWQKEGTSTLLEKG